MSVIEPHRSMPERATELGEYVNFNDEGERQMSLNQSQVEGIARIWIVAIAATLGAVGWMSDFDWAPIVAVLVPIAGSWWSARVNSTNAMVVTVAASPEVKGVVMESKAAANATPNLKASTNVVGPTSEEIKKL